MENFKDIKIGNIVIAYDEYSHDYIEHRIKIESVEHDEAYITEENPEGIVYYGIDLDREDDDDGFISVVTEGNFCRIEKFELWCGCLGNGITVYIKRCPSTDVIQICETATQAAYLAAEWNEVYKNNGTYMY